jgi:hypothetical protein
VRVFAWILAISLVAGCATMNDALMPSLSVIKDDFNGSTIVRQYPVSSSSSLSEGWHTLGFEWIQKTPDTIFITAGTNGIVNITDVAFNADGQVISSIKPASTITEYGQWSTRRFAMSWEDFLKVANAKSVKMKVVRINDYTVSSFGFDHSEAIVNTKIPPFVEKVRELRSGVEKKK